MAIEWRHWWAISCQSELEIILYQGEGHLPMAWDRESEMLGVGRNDLLTASMNLMIA
uniref:Uncharacterized protein n=1 Tax=Oryza sativa subsp. japonica TaxID=39947 RepID=Q2QUP6_ORYSJ|nr:hypothetical protein LOC_Os12g15540 [Oryza sativa Japonica Group]